MNEKEEIKTLEEYALRRIEYLENQNNILESKLFRLEQQLNNKVIQTERKETLIKEFYDIIKDLIKDDDDSLTKAIKDHKFTQFIHEVWYYTGLESIINRHPYLVYEYYAAAVKAYDDYILEKAKLEEALEEEGEE